MSVFGWIIIHQHLGYNYDWNLPWANYKAGFGSIDDNFWLGLEKMHLLISSRAYRLRVEMKEYYDNSWYSAEYWSFKIGDELNDKYRLEVSGYSGEAGDSLQYEDRGGIWYHKEMRMIFSGFRSSTGRSRSVTRSTTNIDWRCLDTAETPVTRCSMTKLLICGITTACHSRHTTRTTTRRTTETVSTVALVVGGTTTATIPVSRATMSTTHGGRSTITIRTLSRAEWWSHHSKRAVMDIG